MPKIFFFDLNLCTGCGACIIACSIENSERQGLNWRRVFTFNETRHPSAPLFNLSLACHHCLFPACVKACPAGAIQKDRDFGAVIVNSKHCLGCKFCTWACPYDAPQYNPAKGVTEKCDFCLERLKRGEATACAAACPTGALQLEDAQARPNPARMEGITEAGLEPSIRFKPLRPQQRVPEATALPDPQRIERLFLSSQAWPLSKINLKSEWALLVFTSLAFILAALFTSSLILPLRINPLLFLAAGLAAMGLSLIHLGQKQRAYRALFNLKSSWLSREIFFFSFFLSSSFLYLWSGSISFWTGWVVALTGFLGLFSIDRIYQVAMRIGPLNFHSAHTLLDGGYLLGALIGNIGLFALLGLMKLCLYAYRKYYFKKRKRRTHPGVSAVRIVLGFVIPAGLFFYHRIWHPQAWSWTGLYGVLIASLLLGELIDRVEYYHELEIVTPRKQMLMDLERFLKNHRAGKWA